MIQHSYFLFSLTCVNTVLISIIVFYFVRVSANVQDLKNHHDNNIRSVLLKILYDELWDLGDSSRIERSLWFYFKNKLSDVAQAYYELKNNGIGKINEAGFASVLLGSGTLELIFQNPDFPDEFTGQIDAINHKNFTDFKNSVFVELQLNKTDNQIAIIKTVTTEMFRKNIKAIYKLFIETKHLVVEKKTGCEKKNANDITCNESKQTIKDLISNNDLDQAIESLINNINESSPFYNELKIISARLNTFLKNERINTGTNNTEINKIRQSLLEITDSI